jgi:hypothetical protein
MAGSILKVLRSNTAGNRPSGRAYGEPYVNFADGQFGIVNPSGANQDLLGTPIFSTLASYPANVAVNNGGRLYRSLVAITPGAFNPANWSQFTTSYDTDLAYLKLSGGTLTGALTLAADPAVNLGAATKQYVDNKPTGGAPQCGYFYAASSSQCLYVPYYGATVRISSVDHLLPGGGLSWTNTNQRVESVNGQSLAGSTNYYAYVYWTGSAMATNFSQTSWAYDSGTNSGVAVKSNDNTQSLVGLVTTNASGQFVDSVNQRMVISWFNKRWKTSAVGLGNNSTSSSTPVAIGTPVYVTVWGDEDVQAWVNGQMGGVSGGFCQCSIGIDGGNSWGSAITFSSDYYTAAMSVIGSGLLGSSGVHYFYVFIAQSGSSAGMTLNNGNLFCRIRG